MKKVIKIIGIGIFSILLFLAIGLLGLYWAAPKPLTPPENIQSVNDIDTYFTNGIGRFIFEGVERKTDCQQTAENCYIEIAYKKKGVEEPQQKSRVYLDLHDVSDYFDLIKAGPSAQLTSPRYTAEDVLGYEITVRDAFHALYEDDTITTEKHASLNIYDQLYSSADINNDYIIQHPI